MFTIGIDLDNTFWNLGETALQILNEKHKQNCSFENLYSYDVSMAHPDFRNEDMNEVYLEASKSCKPYKYAIETVKYFMKQKEVDVFFVTSSTPEEVIVKNERLHTMFEQYNYHNLIVMQHKELLNVDVMIDDLYRNLTNPHLKLGILYSQPYNINDIPINNHKVKRVYEWSTMQHYLNKQLFNIF